MKILVIAIGIMFSFNSFSQLEPTIKEAHQKKIVTPETSSTEIQTVEIEVTEMEERIITKKTYPRMIIFISEKKEE